MKPCSYNIKDVCPKEHTSFEICNICIHASIHKMLEELLEKKLV